MTPDQRKPAWILGLSQVVWVVWANPYCLVLLQLRQWIEQENFFYRNSLQNAQTTQTNPLKTRMDAGFLLVWACTFTPDRAQTTQTALSGC